MAPLLPMLPLLPLLPSVLVLASGGGGSGRLCVGCCWGLALKPKSATQYGPTCVAPC
jgi:hypothetical protein